MHTIRTIDIDRHKQRLMYYMPTYIDRICENMCLPTSKQATGLYQDTKRIPIMLTIKNSTKGVYGDG